MNSHAITIARGGSISTVAGSRTLRESRIFTARSGATYTVSLISAVTSNMRQN